MSSQSYTATEEGTPSASFQKLCQQMLVDSSNTLTKQNVEDFRVILHMIMHDCSKANIEAGKTWIFEHCQTSQHIAAILEYVHALTISRNGQEDRIHMVYLVNDVLYHSARKQKVWMKEAMIPFLSPLLKLAYEAAGSPEYKAKVMKVINIWNDKNILDQQLISNIKRDVSDDGSRAQQPSNYTQQRPPQQFHSHPTPPMMHASATAAQHQPQPFQRNPMFAMPPPAPFPPPHTNQTMMHPPPPPPFGFHPYPPQPFLPPPSMIPPPFMPSMPPPPLRPSFTANNSRQLAAVPPSTPPTPTKPYHELPAGLMLLAKNDVYEPINPSEIKPLLPERQPSQELLKAVDEFYQGLGKIEAMDEDDAVVMILDEQQKEGSKVDGSLKMDAQGWEKGYLDSYFQSMAQRKMEREEARRKQKELELRRAVEEEEERGRGKEKYRSTRRSSRRRRSSSSYGSRERRRRRERSRSYSRGRRGRSRSRSPVHQRYATHSRSRSRGRSRDRYAAEERGRSRYHRYHTTSSQSTSPPRRHRNSYSRSPSPSSSHRRSRHSPSPSRSRGERRNYPSSSTSSSNRRFRTSYDSLSRSRSRSRSRSPSSADRRGGLGSSGAHAGLGSGTVGSGFDPALPPATTAENRYLGLGSKSAAQQAADEYENFRRAKSKTYNRREPFQPFMCYKCNKAGHLARECNSL